MLVVERDQRLVLDHEYPFDFPFTPAEQHLPRGSNDRSARETSERRLGARPPVPFANIFRLLLAGTEDPLSRSIPSREPQRIAKLLARAGVASRREVERMIADRRIAIEGVPVETPATLLASLKGVTVDGRPVKAPGAARLFRFHKPAGVLTAAGDPRGRATIYDRLPKGLPRLMPVGRLDLNTEGLLLLTTDGGLKRQLELPSTGVERTYRARAFGDVGQDQLERLIEGITIDGIRYGSIDANLERRTGRNAWIELKLTEGKNREVRRVLEHLGLKVSRLIRTAYGPFQLADLPAGAMEEVKPQELAAFRKSLAVP
jgi:23S rRNA pseudouridine2605 synthase